MESLGCLGGMLWWLRLPPPQHHQDAIDRAQGVENLFERQERMVAYGPVFCDITWGAGGTTADVTLDIATRMQNQVRIDFKFLIA